MYRWLGFTVALVVATLVFWPAPSPSGEKGRSKIMVEKLKNSQFLLEGLALSDFDKVIRAAETLIDLSKRAEWMALKTPRFDVHNSEFRRSAEMIIQKARAKNIDGVAYAYVDMTMTCVRCHSYVREVRDARLPGERFGVDGAVTMLALPRGRALSAHYTPGGRSC